MSKIRVLVVEDSLTVRKHLCEVLAGDAELEVAAEASDGDEAIELCRRLRPDVITMDMMLPGTTGLGATEHIMAHCPTPILVVSSSTNRGELFRTYEALAAGAVDVLEKPRGDASDDAWGAILRSTVKLVSRIRVISHPRARLPGARPARPATQMAPANAAAGSRRVEVIALGASTGGPGALVEVLRRLPADLRQPVVVVMHLGAPFAGAFAEWLATQIGREVAYANDGERLASFAGRVALAPPDRHLSLHGGRLVLSDETPRHSCRPSVDVLFEALAREDGAHTAACLLTGMGRDGAAGLLAIRAAGGVTIAQDEATSVVYGMPREAVLVGAAQRILPLGEIGLALAALSVAGAGEARP